MVADRAVHLVLAALEVCGDRGGLTRGDRLRLLLDAVALDLEGVIDAAVVRHVEGVRARRVDGERRRGEA